MKRNKRVKIVTGWEGAPFEGGLAVVIDVIRFSTTVCSLLRAGRSPVYVVEGPKSLRWVPALSSCDVYSELTFSSPGRRFDNSPWLASKLDGGRPAAICTTTGSRAAFASGGADKVVIGGFANFGRVAKLLKEWDGNIWLVPAAGTDRNPLGIEDLACAKAFEDALEGRDFLAEHRLNEVRRSPRVAQFLDYRPETGEKDLALSLRLNSLPIVPELRFLNLRVAAAEPSAR